MPFSFLIERKYCPSENHEIKNGVTILVFAVELQKVRTKFAFAPISERGLGRVSEWHV